MYSEVQIILTKQQTGDCPIYNNPLSIPILQFNNSLRFTTPITTPFYDKLR